MKTMTFQRDIPVAHEVDVCIVGGGMAGVSAAMAAARAGLSILLIEKFGVLGGCATSGGVGNFCGNTVGQGEAFDAIIDALSEFGAIAPIRAGKDTRVFNHEILAVILQELLLRRNVQFVLHTQLVDVCATDGHINGVVICGASGMQAVSAKVYIDCSGDGLLAQRAGCSVMKGGADGWQLPMSLMYFVRHVDETERRCEVPEGWFRRIERREDLPMNTFWPNGLHSNAVKIKVPMYDSTDTQSLTMAEVNGRRTMMSVLDYYQRVEQKSIALDHCSTVIGIREGYRIVGDYVLAVDDLRAGRSFDDVIAVGTFYLDGHKPDDDKRTYILDPATLKVPPYDIPLRTIIARDSDNLLMAGRCFSAEQLALSSARVMTTASMLGQAAGVVASLAVNCAKSVRDIPHTRVQSELLRRGAVLDKDKIDRYWE